MFYVKWEPSRGNEGLRKWLEGREGFHTSSDEERKSWRNAADQAVGGKCREQRLLAGISFYLFILYWSIAN